MEYKSIREMADEWGDIQKTYIGSLFWKQNRRRSKNRIFMEIPANAKKPKDARIKSGKYRKNKSDDA